jgi:hypothetical protein
MHQDRFRPNVNVWQEMFYLLSFELIEDKLDDDVVFHSEDFVDLLGDPRLEYVELDLRHVHLKHGWYIGSEIGFSFC